MRIHKPRKNQTIPKINLLNTCPRNGCDVTLSPQRNDPAVFHQKCRTVNAT